MRRRQLSRVPRFQGLTLVQMSPQIEPLLATETLKPPNVSLKKCSRRAGNVDEWRPLPPSRHICAATSASPRISGTS